MKIWIAAGLVIALGGCRGKKSPTESPSIVEPTAATPTTPEKLEDDPRFAGLFGALKFEAGHRPSGTPRYEDILAAWNEGGVAVSARRQTLGHTMGARFCHTAGTAIGVHLVVCEYESEAVAQVKQRETDAHWKSIPNRESFRNGATLLTVSRGTKTEATEAEVKKLTAVFARLPVPTATAAASIVPMK